MKSETAAAVRLVGNSAMFPSSHFRQPDNLSATGPAVIATKLEGLMFLKEAGLPVPEFWVNELPPDTNDDFGAGWSLRLSLRRCPGKKSFGLSLPRLLFCTDVDQMEAFLARFIDTHDVIVHRISPEKRIGTVAACEPEPGFGYWNVDVYNCVPERTQGRVAASVSIPRIGGRLIRSLEDCTGIERTSPLIAELLSYCRTLPFFDFSLEFIFENERPVFSDLQVYR